MSNGTNGGDGEGFAERVGRAVREVKDDLADHSDTPEGEAVDPVAQDPVDEQALRERTAADELVERELARSETAAPAGDRVDEPMMLADEDERLPWLESDEDYAEESFDLNRLIMIGLIAIVALLGLFGLIYVLTQPSTDEELLAEGSTIEAPDEPFRTAPDDPGGSEVAGTGDMSFEVGEGETRESRLAEGNAAAAPSIDREQAGSSEETAPIAAGSVAVQVAAYSSRERAEQGWRDMAGRFEALSGLSHRVESASVDGATVYRLQALAGSESAAQSVCQSVRAAGGDCQVKR